MMGVGSTRNTSFRHTIDVDDIKLTLSSAYETDYLIIQNGTECVVMDITNDAVKTKLVHAILDMDFRKI